MNGWVERESKYAITQEEMIQALIKEAEKKAWLEAMNFAMKCCSSGYTTGMIRTIFHNKFVEISGEGEKA